MALTNNSGKYDDIINLPRFTSDKHAKMSLYDRAAQFSPFAALTGYDAAVMEAARITERRTELTDDSRAELDRIQHLLEQIIDTEPSVTVTYFLPDKHKSGGKYRTVHSRLIRIDNTLQTLTLSSGEVIHIETVTRLIPDILGGTFNE